MAVPIPKNRWRHGLYRRITLAFVAFVALVLMAQALGLVWISRVANLGSPHDIHERGLAWTRGISADLSQGLEQSADLDVARRLSQLDVTHRIIIVFRDGRVVGPAPPQVVRAVTMDLSQLVDDASVPPSWEESEFCAAALKVHGKVVAVVGLLPPTFFQQFGAIMIAVGFFLLGTTIFLFSIAVVAPVRSRLMDLQMAARRLGTGDLAARARTDGDDEVSEVATSFNSMADQLQKRTTELETSDRLRRQLVADVSHELMTPLTAVLGHLETLNMKDVVLEESERRKQIAIAMREARRLHRVIGDLLNTARYEAGGVQLDVEEISTAALFQQVSLRHEQECRMRDVTFETAVESSAEVFDADPFRIEQAIENVVTNAFRHTPNGGRISLTARTDGPHVVIEVCDSGEGIPAEHLPHIFDRFYKASSAKGIASPGTGLGLSIVKAIVTSHGGRVGATSAGGIGTIVRIELPAGSQIPASQVQS